MNLTVADVVVAASELVKPSPAYLFRATPMDERHTIWTRTEAEAVKIATRMAERSGGRVINRTRKDGAS